MMATLSGTHPIEKVVRDRYTSRIFKKFQTEFLTSNSCMHETLNEGYLWWIVSGGSCGTKIGEKGKVVHYASYDARFRSGVVVPYSIL